MYRCVYCKAEKNEKIVAKYDLIGGEICADCAARAFNTTPFYFSSSRSYEISELAKVDITNSNDIKATINNEVKKIRERKETAVKEAQEKVKKAEEEIKKEAAATARKIEQNADKMIISTGDINRDYEIIGPVYFRAPLNGKMTPELTIKYKKMFPGDKTLHADGSYAACDAVRGNILPFLCFENIKVMAAAMDADAVINVRLDIQVSNGILNFEVGALADAHVHHMELIYGTAVKFKD